MPCPPYFYQIFQKSPGLAFELMGETPPCEYQFRAQEVKAFGFRTDGLMFPRSPDPNHPIILLEAQTKAKALLQRSQQELSEPSQRDNFVELLINDASC
ncbi:UNVERIFIED_CONTAM: hypothetical protein BEN50_05960 [Euhalothece sp. KZN 001]